MKNLLANGTVNEDTLGCKTEGFEFTSCRTSGQRKFR